MYVDLHSDTVMSYVSEGDAQAFYKGKSTKLSLQELYAAGGVAQVLAIFMGQEFFADEGLEDLAQLGDWQYFERCNNLIDRLIQEQENLALACSPEEVYQNKNAGKLSILKSVEGARMVESPEDLERLKAAGIFLITLTWNYETVFGYPHSSHKQEMQKGLKRQGIELVHYMNDLGLIIDSSHLNFGGFWDLIKYSHKPFVASHSNAYSLAAVSRNLTDEMIKALADKGGVMGLNLCPAFISAEKITSLEENLANMTKQIQHILKVGGEDVLAIGTDVDGVGPEEQIPDVHGLCTWLESLASSGIPERVVEKLAYRNFLRCWQDITA